MDRDEAHWARVRRPESVGLPALQQQAVPELRPVDLRVVLPLHAARLPALQLLAARLPAGLAMRLSIPSTLQISEMTQRSMPIDFSFSFNSRGFSIRYQIWPDTNTAILAKQ